MEFMKTKHGKNQGPKKDKVICKIRASVGPGYSENQ